MTSNELRAKFLAFFEKHQHVIRPSSSLIPSNDPSLLFTNAGMVQFKDIFLGLEEWRAKYPCAASSQRCLRAGGKHNDLENVGYTARHHTFFEMLGNFSFGDYFKEQAIKLAWEFLTTDLNLSPDKLWITVYEKDEEARKIWHEKIGLPQNRIISCGEKDNFWSMGETGPCGPCSEIFYDHGDSIPGGKPGEPDADGDRYVEIWNLVFMQYERHLDGSLTNLPKPSVDTGMGLERMCAVMQGVHNNYDTDLFKPIIEYTQNLITDKNNVNTKNHNSLKVLADHIRSTSFLIMDGVIPSNEGRGYVLRRIIRRAIRHGNQIGLLSPFFYKLVTPLIKIMGDIYPDLKKAQATIEFMLKKEEEQFSSTLEQGMKILTQVIDNLESKIIPGELVFKLYDTYGFPVDLTADIGREKKLELDIAGFEREMEKQRKLSQDNQKFTSENISHIAGQLKNQEFNTVSEFTGYEHLEESSNIIAVLKEGLILDKTPFYPESGGQVGDQGIIEAIDKNNNTVFIVTDTKKVGQHILHYGHAKHGEFKPGMSVIARVNQPLRQKIILNHTATHLLHAALKKILGDAVQQKGSLVEPDRLRFDFSYGSPLTRENIIKTENLVNQKIRENYTAEKEITTPEEAVKHGALALFGEKYGDKVRTLKLGDFSYELCGGTHVNRTGDIGFFKIISETGIASGIRRIEAVTGEGAEIYIIEQEKKFGLDTQKLHDDKKQLIKQLELLQRDINKHKTQGLLQSRKIIQHIQIVAETLNNVDMKSLREMVEELKSKLNNKNGIIILGSREGEKVSLIIGVTKDLIEKYPANILMQKTLPFINGKGGGKPDLAQAGGDKPENLSEAMNTVLAHLEKP